MSEDHHLYVFADSFREVDHWARSSNIFPRHPLLVYVTNSAQLVGRRDLKVFFYGGSGITKELLNELECCGYTRLYSEEAGEFLRASIKAYNVERIPFDSGSFFMSNPDTYR